MSDGRKSLLTTLSEEIVALAADIVPSTCIVTGQTKDFSSGSGSAWLYDPRHLVTNHHVIDGLVEPVWVRFPDAQETRAEVLGSDPLTDLAVLRVEHQAARPLIPRLQPARLGELCFAFGSPLGEYPESMTFGIVSGLKRSLATSSGRPIYDVIQTDCAINPGNSGGPLVGVDGAVLGVNSAGIPGADGIGFAIPADTVADIVPELLAYHAIERASLGVSVAARRVADTDTFDRVVVTVARDTAAGPFEKGDILFSLGPHEVRTRQDLIRVLRRDMIENTVAVSVWRNGELVTFECTPSRMGQ